MDPLSITSGIIGLAAIAGKITRALLDLKKVLQSTEAAEELHCYTLLLSELSDLVLKNAVAPPSAFAAAGLCQERLSVLQHAVSARKPDAKAIRAELSSLQASIMLLRQMVMDSTTHTLLQEQREAQVRVMESNISRRAKHEGIIEVNIDPGALAGEDAAKRLQQLLSVYSNPDIDREGILTINVTRNPQEHEDGSERETDLDQLRSQLHKTNLQVQAGKNPFQRAIHVLHADSAQGHLLLIAKIDTASRKNWVRTQVIQQLALEHQVEQLESSVSDWFKGAGGELFQASGRVILTWYDSIVARTRETEFLISCEDAPFDLIFGWEWLTADGESAFAEPFLAIMKKINLSEAENREMQANLFSQTQESGKLAPVRHAEAFNKREARRRQKAMNASLAASAAQTPAFSSIQTPRRSSSPGAGPGAPDPQQPVSRDDSSDQRQPSRD